MEFESWLKERVYRPNTIKKYIFVAAEFKKWHEVTSAILPLILIMYQV
jgi:hypothetical protein